MRSEGERMLGGLLGASHLASIEDLPDLVAEHAKPAGFHQIMIYVVDLQQQYLVPLPGQHDAVGEPLRSIRIDSTLAGRAYRNVEVVQARHVIETEAEAEAGAEGEPEPPAEEGRRRLWVPLLDGTERVGMLAVTVPAADDDIDWRVKQLASLVSLLVISKRDFSDTYASLVRTESMTLSAEVLWNLMPSGSFANDKVVVGAALEPAYDVGGDVYDFALAGDTLHLSIFDAMGHDTSAGLTATIAVGACRNNRLRGTGLLAASEAIDEAIAEQFGATRFATGILADLNLKTGELTWVNRGHHPPLVIRRGRRVATLETVPSPPMGFGLGLSAGLEHYQLERGDRLLFYTDGIIEAQSPEGEEFGLERFIDFVVRREADGMSAPETLRRLIQSILEHQHGRLQDDATVLSVEWHGEKEHRLTM
ncbi:PP2C family protein-serine/threonine phosphatase [Nonomuraea sp. NEAU-A123]|uniref:PP2C family protein-serine/threonine phosphatase n=1 Tax=Nonomuraea sp. NEAU-A123 TaxID=2839649 RepID=UPI001BE44BFF|nr:GAF domain-containing SpoIIE family protein phosphatase [Nonomuraea sp. NEAU-A123]MBT2228427.1 SpoIIE family protein phosphatase [Nonomuraea sp. NEAU-A123]